MGRRFARFRDKLVWRLWGAMMLLVCFGIVFLWGAQTLLFEPHYIRTTLELLKNRIEPIIGDTGRVAGDAFLIELSKVVRGKVFVVDKEGKVLSVYSMGMTGSMEGEIESERFVYRERNYAKVAGGAVVKDVLHKGRPDMKMVMGFPTKIHGEPGAVFFYNSLGELHTMREMMHLQLFLLSIALTAVASAMAFFLAMRFTNPILSIKRSVDGLAGGDLSVTPSDVEQNDEIGQLSHSVAELGVVLRRVDALRKELIANVSHELRAPLSLIVGYGEMVRDVTWSDEKRRNENLNLIIREAERLSCMVSDIMDYSQLQAGYTKLNRSLCNLCKIAASEVEFCRGAAGRYGLSLELESFSTEIVESLDPSKITQVFRNLLNNAVNHAAYGSVITVRVERCERLTRVSIINEGDEIPEEARKIIWERYQRVQHQAGRWEGTGIGLSIVEAILSAHGFRFGVDSARGENTFWFEIPEGCAR